MIGGDDCELIHCVWFCGNGKDQDWMGCLYKSTSGKWVFKYRFRYYNSSDPHSGKDDKHWYAFSTKSGSNQDRDKMLQSTESTLIPMIEMRMQSEADKVELDCKPTDFKFFVEMGSRPWCHIAKLTEEEFNPLV